MIVWGGHYPTNANTKAGGRYNPSTDSWTATSTTNAPSARFIHTAVWTGSEMIVWGGYRNGFLNTGGNTIPAQIVGQPLAGPTRPPHERTTQQCGPAVK